MNFERNRTHIVIAVHGIRTYGHWQKKLRDLLQKEARSSGYRNNLHILPYKYGVFTLFSFLVPYFRRLAVRQFQSYLESLCDDDIERLDIVAHSFGAFLVLEALAESTLPAKVRVNTLILCGAAVTPNRNLSKIVGPSRRVSRLVNECGIKDRVLLLTLFVYGVGMAGRLGIQGLEGYSVTNRYHRLDHSGYFELKPNGPYTGFMTRWWLPLILTAKDVHERDRRPEHPSLLDRIWRILGENGAQVTVLFYATIMVSLALTFAHLRNEQMKASVLATANESRQLTELSRVATDKGRSIDGLKLALASWPRSNSDRRPKLERALQSISYALVRDPGLTTYLGMNRSVRGMVELRKRNALATWDFSGEIQLWNMSTGQLLFPPFHHKKAVRGLLLYQGEKRALSWSADNDLREWNLETGKQIGNEIRFKSEIVQDESTGEKSELDIRRVIASPSETYAVLESTDEQYTEMRIIDLNTRGLISPSLAKVFNLQGAKFSIDEKYLVTWNAQSFFVTSLPDGKTFGPTKFDGQLIGLALTRQNSIITLTKNGALNLWDIQARVAIGKPKMLPGEAKALIHLKHDDSVFVVAEGSSGNDNEFTNIQKWNCADGLQRQLSVTITGRIRNPSLSKNGDRIVLQADDNSLTVRSTSNLMAIGKSIVPTEQIRYSVLSNDGNRVAIWTFKNTVGVYNVHSGEQIRNDINLPEEIEDVFFTDDDRRLMVRTESNKVRIVNLTPRQELDRRGGKFLATSAATEVLAMVAGENIEFVDINSLRTIGMTPSVSSKTYAARFFLNGSRLLVQYTNGTLRIWDVTTRSQVGQTMSHGSPNDNHGFAVSKSGERIITWLEHSGNSEDGIMLEVPPSPQQTIVKLWNARTGRLISELSHPTKVNGAIFSADDGHILSWSEDNNAWLWNTFDASRPGKPFQFPSFSEGSRQASKIQRIYATTDENKFTAVTGEYGFDIAWFEIAPGLSLVLPDFEDYGDWIVHADVVLGSELDRFQLFDARSGGRLGAKFFYGARPFGFALIKDKTELLTWNAEGIVVRWNVHSGEPIGPPMKAESKILDLQVLNNESRFISRSRREVQLWDLSSGQVIGPPIGRVESQAGAALNKGSRRIVGAGRYEGIQLWDIDWPQGNIIEIACAVLPNTSLTDTEFLVGKDPIDPICMGNRESMTIDWKFIERFNQ